MIRFIGHSIVWFSVFMSGLLVGMVVFTGNSLFMAWDWGMDKSGRKRIIYDRDQPTSPYLVRYYLLFRDRHNFIPFNIFIHKFLKSDGDDIHDHPWDYGTLILHGGYKEYILDKIDNSVTSHWRSPGFYQFVRAEHAHRIELATIHCSSSNTTCVNPCWTLFIAFGKKRLWGFYEGNDRSGWKESTEYSGQTEMHAIEQETQTENTDTDKSVSDEEDNTSSMWFLGNVVPTKKNA